MPLWLIPLLYLRSSVACDLLLPRNREVAKCAYRPVPTSIGTMYSTVSSSDASGGRTVPPICKSRHFRAPLMPLRAPEERQAKRAHRRARAQSSAAGYCRAALRADLASMRSPRHAVAKRKRHMLRPRSRRSGESRGSLVTIGVLPEAQIKRALPSLSKRARGPVF
jgi:hypothetical protein